MASQGISDIGHLRQDANATWSSLFAFCTRKNTLILTFALLITLVSSFIGPFMAYVFGKIFNSFTEYGSAEITGHELMNTVIQGIVALLVLGSVTWILKGTSFLSWMIFGEQQSAEARRLIFLNMLQRDLEWFDLKQDGIGALLPRIQAQIQELQLANSQPLSMLSLNIFTILVALVFGLLVNWRITLATLSTTPLTIGIAFLISRKIQPKIQQQMLELSGVAKLVTSVINAIDVVKYFNGENFEVSEMHNRILRAAALCVKQARLHALEVGGVRFFSLSLFVQAFWYGSSLVRDGICSPGSVLTAFWACLLVTESIARTLPQAIVFEKGKNAGATLRATIAHIERGRPVSVMRGMRYPLLCQGVIEVKNVSFAYPTEPTRLVLKNASFHFPAAKVSFVIGRSGSGKSTLGSLLLRFYVPKSGEITIDGLPIQTIDPQWIRNNLTFVEQQSVLFNETILRNIAFGKQDHWNVSPATCEGPISFAQLQETIATMPNGIETLVGTSGNSLSGGQKQRIALARAKLRNTPILILDESTSALDPITKSLVMQAIREWREGKTTIIITHDISQILPYDKVYVLRDGSIVQEGLRIEIENQQDGVFASFVRAGDDPRNAVNSSSYEDSVHSSDDEDSSDEWEDVVSSMSLAHSHSISFASGFTPRIPSFVSTLDTPRRVDPFFERFSTRHSAPTRPFDESNSSAIELSAYPSRLEAGSSRRDTSSISSSAWESTIQVDPHAANNHGRASTSICCNIRKFFAIIDKRIQVRSTIEETRSTGKILMSVWPNLFGNGRAYISFALMCSLLHAAITPIFSWVFSQLLATFYSGTGTGTGTSKQSIQWSVVILVVALLDGLISYGWIYYWEKAGQQWVDNLRMRAYRRVLAQPKAWFESAENSISHIAADLDRNAEEMRNLVGRFLCYMTVTIFMVLIAVTWSLAVCWKLTLVGLSATPVLWLTTSTFKKISVKWEAKTIAASEIVTAVFAETFVNVRTVRSLTLEEHFHKKAIDAIENAYDVGVRRAFRTGLCFGLNETGILFVTAFVFFYGAHLVSTEQASVQSVITVMSMLLFSVSSSQNMISLIPQMNAARAAATRLLRLADLEEDSSVGERHIKNTGTISFRHLDFAYPSRPEHVVLRDFSLMIAPHTCYAIAGASGSGKSTIINLLMGLYSPPDHGMLRIGPVDIKDIYLPSLRSLVAVVSQSPVLFATTISANITYGLSIGDRIADRNRVREAARAAGIDDFIQSLPQGYNTVVGDGGVGLSGGQMQRIAIARALIRKPKVLILDEATSALDSESSRVIRDTVRVLKGLRHMAERPTIIIITHSKEMMMMADKVIMVEQGRVAQEGPWNRLLRTGGAFKRLMSGGVGANDSG